MTEVTIITPIAPHHVELFSRCRDSVEKQTVAVRHLHMVDKDNRGPGYIRNQLLKQVKTEYVVFLDADDYLEPAFVEECLQVVEPDYYVFTDWYQGARVMTQQPGKFWETALHLITCLIHTDMMRAVGGFDEKLEALEDTDLFLKFNEYGYCGVKLELPLLHYTDDGQRGDTIRANGKLEGIKNTLIGRYRSMGCCSDDNNIKGASPPVGKKAPGDVLVMALWQGNQVTGGAVSGRRYPRASRPKRIWLDPRDAKARPDLYRVIPPKRKPAPKKEVKSPKKSPPPRGGSLSFGDMLLAAGIAELPNDAPLPVVASKLSPNFNAVNEIAKRIYS